MTQTECLQCDSFLRNPLQVSSLQSLDQLSCWEDMRDNSAEILFQFFLFFILQLVSQLVLWAQSTTEDYIRAAFLHLAWEEMSALWCCPSSISFADHSVVHHPRCPEGWFWWGCCGVWHAQTMQVSVSWQNLLHELAMITYQNWGPPVPSIW